MGIKEIILLEKVFLYTYRNKEMKRVRCPKCENYLTFDETKYSEGQSLVFICDQCKKQFSIRLGKTPTKLPVKKRK